MKWTNEQEMRAIARDIQAIERARGIEKEAERARDGPLIPLHAFSKTPFGTPESLQEICEERMFEAAEIGRRIRTLYFAVPDVEARLLLIHKTRELEALRKSTARQAQRQADTAVISPGRPRRLDDAAHP